MALGVTLHLIDGFRKWRSWIESTVYSSSDDYNRFVLALQHLGLGYLNSARCSITALRTMVNLSFLQGAALVYGLLFVSGAKLYRPSSAVTVFQSAGFSLHEDAAGLFHLGSCRLWSQWD